MPRPGQPLLHVSAPSASDVPPMPASVSTIALWQSEKLTSGSPLATWTDSSNGRVLAQATSGNRPIIAADGSYFNARPVVQTNIANSRYLSTGVLGTQLWSAGAKIWTFSVLRQRAATSTARCWMTGNHAAGGNYDLTLVHDSGQAQFTSANNSGVMVSVAETLTQPRLYSAGITSGGQNALVIDGVAKGTNGTGLGAAACSLISVGCYMGPGQFNDLSLALLWFLSGRPTAPEEAAILAWSREYYGTP